MKRILASFVLVTTFNTATAQDTTHSTLNDTLVLQHIEISAVRAADRAPFTKYNISKQEIEEQNLGQDLPFLLNQSPSVIVNSDAGNGVGYTGMRIRGSDASRINVTLNGIPYNDAESQGTFFVDMPDVASSLQSVQVQRGVGTSSNGAGAFGASVHLSTNEVNKEKYTQVNNSFGSFNTWKNTIKAGTGLLAKHFIFDGRFSRITSDGYIDRAFSNLQSFYLSGLYLDDKSSLRFNVISGKEKTYQAWGGVPESLLATHRTYNPSGTDKPGEPYDNETDNFIQTHYQLFYNRQLSNRVKLNTTFYLTRGKGYYEEYRADQKYKNYGVPDVIAGADTISRTDLVRQKWLDNYLYGSLVSIQYTQPRTQFTFGGGWSRYDGGHYGIIKWAAQGGFPIEHRYYETPAQKTDVNTYAKIMQSLGSGFTGFLDVQGRFIKYDINGFKDNPALRINRQYAFFNPKIGISYNRSNYQAFLSFSIAAHEPNRDDYEAGKDQLPKPEKLYDWELGLRKENKKYNYGVVLYYMQYQDQLVNTGKINDVGAYTRTNAARSYRAGAELEAGALVTPWYRVSGNIAFSRNKISDFVEYTDNYDDASGKQVENSYTNTDISFSPGVVAAASMNFTPLKNGDISLQSKYVSRQFLDNTSHESRSIPAYFTQNVRLTYSPEIRWVKKLDLVLQVNNIFDKKYVANGYTFNYISGGALTVENYYFPMAGVNFMAAIQLKF